MGGEIPEGALQLKTQRKSKRMVPSPPALAYSKALWWWEEALLRVLRSAGQEGWLCHQPISLWETPVGKKVLGEPPSGKGWTGEIAPGC